MGQNKKQKTALITGVTGQDGSYLAELLLKKGYKVYGLQRRSSTFNTSRIDHLYDHPKYPTFTTVFGDLSDSSNLSRLLAKIKPDEIYNLGAQSVAEECLCPILSAQKMDYRTLGNLWNEQVKKNKKIIVDKISGVKTEIIDLPHNTQLKALGIWNGMGTWFPIKQISRHWWDGKMVKMSQKFGSIIVTPNHSILDIQGKLCVPKDNPWLLNIRKLNYRPNKYKKSINLKLDGSYKSDENYFWLDEKGVLGKVLRIVADKKLEAFCRFIGAFIAEGHTTFNKANKNWYVGISNSDKKWLENLGVDLRMFYDGKFWYIKHKKDAHRDVWELQIKSRALYNLFRKLLGENSKAKQLPYWFSQLEDQYLREIWKKMLEGDGNIDSKSGFRYTTASYKLACQLSWLFTILGYDYTVHEEKSSLNSVWHFRECSFYQPGQGSKDKKLVWINYSGWVYDITVNEVNNFTVGVGNIVVHNSHVGVSFQIPEYTANVTGLGALRLLDAIRESGIKTKYYQASSSEMFGKVLEAPQKETTPFNPQSPYGVSKAFAYWMTKIHRDAYGLFASNGILFNHESPRRGETFVTRKITIGLSKVKLGLQDVLSLGNLDSKRDWGYAKDYVEAIWKILQHKEPDDFLIATGETHTVREFVEEVGKNLSYNIMWRGKGVNEVGYDKKSGKVLVNVDKILFRPAEVDFLLGDASKARKVLKWKPKVAFQELAKLMTESDFENVSKSRGHKIQINRI